jgi:hypothetical protein
MSSMSGLPVAVIGAEPVGLAATAHLLMRERLTCATPEFLGAAHAKCHTEPQ